MCTLVSRVHMAFYISTKRYTVPENQGTHDKLNKIQKTEEPKFDHKTILCNLVIRHEPEIKDWMILKGH